jgi:hypothetical protein
MPEQPVQVPPFDAGNQLLTSVPAQLAVFDAQDDAGRPLVGMTIRTVDTTLTVLAPRAAALAWAELIRSQAQATSALIVPNGNLPNLGPLGGQQ